MKTPTSKPNYTAAKLRAMGSVCDTDYCDALNFAADLLDQQERIARTPSVAHSAEQVNLLASRFSGHAKDAEDDQIFSALVNYSRFLGQQEKDAAELAALRVLYHEVLHSFRVGFSITQGRLSTARAACYPFFADKPQSAIAPLDPASDTHGMESGTTWTSDKPQPASETDLDRIAREQGVKPFSGESVGVLPDLPPPPAISDAFTPGEKDLIAKAKTPPPAEYSISDLRYIFLRFCGKCWRQEETTLQNAMRIVQELAAYEAAGVNVLETPPPATAEAEFAEWWAEQEELFGDGEHTKVDARIAYLAAAAKSEAEIAHWKSASEDWKGELLKAEKRIAELEAQLSGDSIYAIITVDNQRKRIAELKHKIEVQVRDIENANANIREKKARITELDHQVHERDETIVAMKDELARGMWWRPVGEFPTRGVEEMDCLFWHNDEQPRLAYWLNDCWVAWEIPHRPIRVKGYTHFAVIVPPEEPKA